jgi:hypothetical protein
MGPLAKFFMDHKSSSDWAARRRIIFCSLIWEAMMITAIIVWSMFHTQTNPLLDTAFINLNGLFAGIFASYVFGSILDDNNKAKSAVASQAISQGQPTTTDVTVTQ